MGDLNIQALYWSNVRRFWQTSFYDNEDIHSIYNGKIAKLHCCEARTPEEEIWYRLLKDRNSKQRNSEFGKPPSTEVGMIPFWIMEFILFIPSIIIFPFIRTIIDVFTRKPQSQASNDSLIKSLQALLDSKPKSFDTLVEVLAFKQSDNNHIFKSLNSQDLIADLHFFRIEEQIKPEMSKWLEAGTSKQDIDDLFSMEGPESLNNKYPSQLVEKRKTYVSYSPLEKMRHKDLGEEIALGFMHGNPLLYRILSLTNNPIDDKHQELRRQKQLDAIVDYLLNPENNGSKLAQYFQINITDLHHDESTRSSSLKLKALIECERLNRISNSSSLDKEVDIRQVIDSKTLNEKNLMQALSVQRGFGFFGNMTSSFDKVYCSDIPAKQDSNSMFLNV